jgi:hypothetical protein
VILLQVLLECNSNFKFFFYKFRNLLFLSIYLCLFYELLGLFGLHRMSWAWSCLGLVLECRWACMVMGWAWSWSKVAGRMSNRIWRVARFLSKPLADPKYPWIYSISCWVLGFRYKRWCFKVLAHNRTFLSRRFVFHLSVLCIVFPVLRLLLWQLIRCIRSLFLFQFCGSLYRCLSESFACLFLLVFCAIVIF